MKDRTKPSKPFAKLPAPKNAKRSWIKIILQVLGSLGIVSLVAFLGFFANIFNIKDRIHKWTTPDITLAEEEKFVNGILIPDLVLAIDTIKMEVGSSAFRIPVKKLSDGGNFSYIINRVSCGGDDFFPSLKLYLNGNKLYVSDSLFDFENGHLIGELNYDRLKLAKGEYYSCDNCSERKLRIIDRSACVVFSLQYMGNATVRFAGYFIGKNTVCVAEESGAIHPCIFKVVPNYKEEIRNWARAR